MYIADELFEEAKAVALHLKKENQSKDAETIFYNTMEDIEDFVSSELYRVERYLREFLKISINNDLKISEDENE